MKTNALFRALLLASGAAFTFTTAALADFEPIPLTPETFTADVVVENTAPTPPNAFVTATMDGGTNNSSRTYYEQGFNTNHPATGLPPSGSVFTATADPTHEFQMPDYAANNALFINSQVPQGNLKPTTPKVLTALSLLGASGGSAVVINCTVQYQDGTSEQLQATVPDWFNGAAVAWTANGRYNLDNLQFDNILNNNPRIYYTDIFVTGVTAVTNVVFDYVSGSGRSCILGLAGQETPGGNFTPLPVTGYTRDMVVEAAAPRAYGSLYSVTTATMDGGANNNSRTWYEQGLNTGTPASGLPAAGTTINAVGAANHAFAFPASYVGNNAVFIASTDPNGTLTLNTPTALTGLSVVSSCGGGAVAINYTVHFADNSTEAGSFTSADWFNTTDATTAWTANGRFNTDNCAFENVNATPQVPRLHFNDIVLANTASPVTSIDFSYGGTGGRCSIFAVSGQSTVGGNFAPLAVSGFTRDMVVEKTDPVTLQTQPARLGGFTTVSMDGGTNNTGNTWYEQGYYPNFPTSGLPPAGSTLTSISLPDHRYMMPADYAANNAIFVDAAHPLANVTPVTPAWYSALSFLSATANGDVTNQCIMQYEDGTSETNLFVSKDWFNNSPEAYRSLGRVNLNNQSINNDPGRNGTNPRLYEAQFALNTPPGNKLTNVVLTYLGSPNPAARMVALAVSGTTGEVAPIIRDQPASRTVLEGSNVVIVATSGGGTPPISFQWQVGTNNVWVNVINGGKISGAQATSLSITDIGWTNAADYRLIAIGPSLSTTSAVATVAVLSGLPDVTQPNDPVALYQPNMGGGAPPAAEDVDKAIDNTTSKYLNRGAGTTPFTGPGGLTVTPLIGGTILEVLRFYTANDADGRDPADFTLEGSNDGGETYTIIAAGPISLPAGRNAAALALDPLTQPMREVRFANSAGYTSYRLGINAVKGNETLMQFGEVEFLGKVNPNAVPTITERPVDQIVNEGGTATFTVAAVGPGPIGYQWYNVTGGEPGTLIPGANSGTLTLSPVTAAMSGNTYRVAVTNANGSVRSPGASQPGAMLTVVSGPPFVTTDLSTETVVYVGRTAVLPVILTGTEPFTSQWQYNSADLSDTARISGSHSNVLTIANAQPADAGIYQLFVSNGQGNAQSLPSTLVVQKAAMFSDSGAGWGLNGTINGVEFPASMAGGLLDLTLGTDNARTAWYRFPQYIRAFTASFTYQDVGGGGADGMAFVVQNDPRGTTAVGGGGGSLAYSGITPSVALQFNIFGTAGYAFNTNGNTGNYQSSDPVNVASGDPIDVHLTYRSGVMYLTLSNTTTAATYSTAVTVGDITAVLGGETAIIGFTGASGGTASTQQITSFRFVPLPAVTVALSGANLILSWPASIGAFGVESRTGLTSGTWTPVVAPINLVGDHYEVSVPLGTAPYFRLALQ